MSLTQIKRNKFRDCFFCVCFFLATLGITAQAAEENNTETPPEIQVSADKLISDRNKKYAEFIGNVVAVRDNATLKCNRLKIFYKEKNKEAPADDKAGAVEKMIASEAVRLTFDDKTAVAEKAVYISKTDSIVLTGGSPKVTSGNSYVTGDKITLFRTDGRVIVDGGENQRVRAKFHPQDEKLLKNKKD